MKELRTACDYVFIGLVEINLMQKMWVIIQLL